MSGFPRPDWRAGPGRVSPINRLRRRARPRFKGPSFNRIVPNLMTLIGLCAGLTSMRFAHEGRFGSAAVAIVFAGAIDGLDGRLARLLKATSRFGFLAIDRHCRAVHMNGALFLSLSGPGDLRRCPLGP